MKIKYIIVYDNKFYNGTDLKINEVSIEDFGGIEFATHFSNEFKALDFVEEIITQEYPLNNLEIRRIFCED